MELIYTIQIFSVLVRVCSLVMKPSIWPSKCNETISENIQLFFWIKKWIDSIFSQIQMCHTDDLIKMFCNATVNMFLMLLFWPSGCCFLLLIWVHLITRWPPSKSRPTTSSSTGQVRVMHAGFVRIGLITWTRASHASSSSSSPLCSPNFSSSLSHIWSSTQAAPHHSHPGSVLHFDAVWDSSVMFWCSLKKSTSFDLIAINYQKIFLKRCLASHFYINTKPLTQQQNKFYKLITSALHMVRRLVVCDC